jgi:hypothetical protein
MMNAAVRLGVTDAVGLALLIHEHGAFVMNILDELDDYAEACRHSNPRGCEAWIQIRNAVRCLETLDSTEEDRFGFKAEAEAIAIRVLRENKIERP